MVHMATSSQLRRAKSPIELGVASKWDVTSDAQVKGRLHGESPTGSQRLLFGRLDMFRPDVCVHLHPTFKPRGGDGSLCKALADHCYRFCRTESVPGSVHLLVDRPPLLLRPVKKRRLGSNASSRLPKRLDATLIRDSRLRVDRRPVEASHSLPTSRFFDGQRRRTSQHNGFLAG